MTNWEWLLHEFGLCTVVLKSFLASPYSNPLVTLNVFNKTKPFFFQWAISHSPYQTVFHSSSPRWITLPQAKSSRNLPRNNFFPYSFLGKHAVTAIIWWTTPNCCQSWGLDASTWLIPLEKPLHFVFLWTSVTATVFQVGRLMSFLTISIWTCSNV